MTSVAYICSRPSRTSVPMRFLTVLTARAGSWIERKFDGEGNPDQPSHKKERKCVRSRYPKGAKIAAKASHLNRWDRDEEPVASHSLWSQSVARFGPQKWFPHRHPLAFHPNGVSSQSIGFVRRC